MAEGRSEASPDETRSAAEPDETRPTWDDAYLDEVAGRLETSYDLEPDYPVEGTGWALYGELVLKREKYFLHPTLSYGQHDSDEHLLARRVETVDSSRLDSLVDLGHRLADEWVVPDERHYSTEFTFVLVVPEITDPVADYVDGFRDRTLLKYGYFGHYEVNLVVVAPETETLVASEQADVAAAFRTWGAPPARERGLFGRLADAIFE
ncbi:hypothetical protein [Halococcus hamelinensis]|uniref:DUF8052 domain-containing protein n=1 Tax=Halococcus hamelinensis 100A6 TaxID=1132509 RepID=M0M5Q8_9EURY|nr:hypothetical protein [Halococcus hamelinensis]EMA39954.1 hypothetical protein C447_05363 [Halococcus hamelinensis 100A6]